MIPCKLAHYTAVAVNFKAIIQRLKGQIGGPTMMMGRPGLVGSKK